MIWTFEKRRINVDHQLLKDTEHGYYIDTPKTKSGIRQIPMNQTAYEAFKRVLKQCNSIQTMTIDGYSGFLFRSQKGSVMTNTNYEMILKGLL